MLLKLKQREAENNIKEFLEKIKEIKEN